MRQLLFGVSALLFGLSLYAQNYKFDDASVQARLEKDLRILAHDSLKGREAGTDFERKAIDYIVAQYKEIGLEEHPSFKGYLQPFSLNKKFNIESSGLHIVDTSFAYGDYYISAYSASGGAVGKAVYYNDKDLRTIESENKSNSMDGTVALLEIVADGESMNYIQACNNLQWKMKVCQQHGAEAVVFLNNRHNYYNLFDWGEAERLDIPVFVFKSAYYKYIKSRVGEKFELSAKLKRNDNTAYNVIGFIDNNAEHTVVIGGHYDHVGMGNFGSRYNGGNAIHNGADDNASGTVTVIELARYIKKAGLKNYNYLFIAFGAEEKGLIGSKYFCNSGEFDVSKINYMVNFDMVGRMRKLRNKCIVLGYKTSPVLKEVVQGTRYKRGRLTKIRNGMDASDHAYFFKKEVPFIYFTTGLHSDYHTPTDDTETINFKGMVKITKYVEELVVKLDNEPKAQFSDPGNINMLSLISLFLP